MLNAHWEQGGEAYGYRARKLKEVQADTKVSERLWALGEKISSLSD